MPSGVHKNHNIVENITTNIHHLTNITHSFYRESSLVVWCNVCMMFTKCHCSLPHILTSLWSPLLSSGSDQCDWCQRVSSVPPQSCVHPLYTVHIHSQTGPGAVQLYTSQPPPVAQRPASLSVHLTTASKLLQINHQEILSFCDSAMHQKNGV